MSSTDRVPTSKMVTNTFLENPRVVQAGNGCIHHHMLSQAPIRLCVTAAPPLIGCAIDARLESSCKRSTRSLSRGRSLEWSIGNYLGVEASELLLLLNENDDEPFVLAAPSCCTAAHKKESLRLADSYYQEHMSRESH